MCGFQEEKQSVVYYRLLFLLETTHDTTDCFSSWKPHMSLYSHKGIPGIGIKETIIILW